MTINTFLITTGILLLPTLAVAGAHEFSPTQGVLRGQQAEQNMWNAQQEVLQTGSEWLAEQQRTQDLLNWRQNQQRRAMESLSPRRDDPPPNRGPVQCYTTRSGNYLYTSCY